MEVIIAEFKLTAALANHILASPPSTETAVDALVTEAKNGALSSLVQAARAAHANPKIRQSGGRKKKAKTGASAPNQTMKDFFAKSATSLIHSTAATSLAGTRSTGTVVFACHTAPSFVVH